MVITIILEILEIMVIIEKVLVIVEEVGLRKEITSVFEAIKV